MTENQVRIAAILAVGFAIGALKRITAKRQTVKRARRKSGQERLGGIGCDVATNATMTDVSNGARGLPLASTSGKENMNANIICAFHQLQTGRDVITNVTVTDVRNNARSSHITITARGQDTSSVAIKKESTSAKVTSAFDQLQTQ